MPGRPGGAALQVGAESAPAWFSQDPHQSIVQDESRASQAAVDQVGAVLDLLEPMLHGPGDLAKVGGGEVAEVALDQGPDALLRVEVWGVGRQLEHGEPLGARNNELPYSGRQVEADVIPNQHNRAAELSVRANDQNTEVPPAEALRLILAAPVLAYRIDQPGPLAGFVAGHTRHRHASGATPSHSDDGSLADPAPGPGTRWSHRLPGFVLEDHPGAAFRRDALTRGQVSFLHASTASSSRSIALRAGCCQDQPCRFINRQVPSTEYET